jgi:hypothetical protein
MQTNPPSALSEVLKQLPATWQLAALKFWAMGWIAELHTGSRRFELIADRGYIEIYELGDYEPAEKHEHQLGPTLAQVDAATPGIIFHVLCNAVA